MRKRLRKTEILVLRMCGANGESYAGFHWPLEVGAEVEAPDWQDNDICSGGLHGLPWGQGGDYCSLGAPVWLVLVVDTAGQYRHGAGDMTDKCKFRSCRVWGVYDNANNATQEIIRHAPVGTLVNYVTLTGGYRATLTGGHGSTLTGGDWSTLTGGDWSMLTGGRESTLTGGDESMLCWRVWEGTRFRLHVRYVGEDGVRPGVPYRYDDGKLVPQTCG